MKYEIREKGQEPRLQAPGFGHVRKFQEVQVEKPAIRQIGISALLWRADRQPSTLNYAAS